MAYESHFNADKLDLDAALLAGFGLEEKTEGTVAREEGESGTMPLLAEHAGHPQAGHGQITHRVGKVGRLQVTFVYHHGDHHHE